MRTGLSKYLVIGAAVMLAALCCFKVFKYANNSRYSDSNQTVTLYGYDGSIINRWSGKISISETTNKINFTVDDHHIIISGGITVIEEEK